jgi:hypothetical protein
VPAYRVRDGRSRTGHILHSVRILRYLAARRIRRSQRACLPRITDQCTRLRKIHQGTGCFTSSSSFFRPFPPGGGKSGDQHPFPATPRPDPPHGASRSAHLAPGAPRLNSLTRGCAGACPCPSLSVPVLFGARPTASSKSSRPLQPTFPLPVPTRNHNQSEFHVGTGLDADAGRARCPWKKGGHPQESSCKPRGHPDDGTNTSIWLR